MVASSSNPGVGRYLMGNVVVVFVALLVNQIVQTAGAAILTHIVANPARYGEINVLLQILGLVGIFLSLGLNSALTYALATRRPERDDAFWLTLWVSVGFGVVLAGSLALSAGIIASLYRIPALAPAIVIMGLILVVNSLANILTAVLSGQKLFRRQALAMVLPVFASTVGMVMGAAISLRWHHLLLWVALGQVVGTVVGVVAIGVLSRPYLPRLFRPDWSYLRALLHYGLPMWAGNIFKSFQQPFLVITMGLVSFSAAGFLTNSLKIIGFIANITWAFNIVVLPWLSEVQHQPELIRMRATLAFRYNNYLIYPLSLVTIMERHWISVAVFGPQYAHTAAYLLPATVAIGLSSVSRLGGTLLAGIGQPRGNFWPMVASGLVTLIGTPLLLLKAGPVAAVYPYLWGWVLATALTIAFALKDGLWLDYGDAFGRPMVPSAAMVASYGLAKALGLGPLGSLLLALAVLATVTGAIEIEQRGRWGARHIQRLKRHVPFHPPWA
jgi:O-antigen/teichoic acid export membrane protein